MDAARATWESYMDAARENGENGGWAPFSSADLLQLPRVKFLSYGLDLDPVDVGE